MKKRQRESKTDYKLRIGLLKSGKARVVFRKTDKYIIGQYIKSKEAKDFAVASLTSKELLKYGWPVSAKGSLKSIPACYLTGFLLGKKIMEEEKEKAGAIFDLGLIRNIPKSRAYSFLKGLIDFGVKIKCDEKMFPDEKRLRGGHLKISLDFNKIKESIESKS